MSMILSYPKFGNLRIYDLNNKTKGLSDDFKNLTVDPYVKEGYRRKHISRFRFDGKSYIEKENAALFQSSLINPTHGNITRVYPSYIPSQKENLLDVLRFFTEATDMPPNQNILVQAQRITCERGKAGLPSVENWHRDGVTKIGILCVDRNNINGGTNEFRQGEDVLSIMMMPGQIAVFQDADIMHRVTPITSDSYGYRDVMLFAYPDCSI